MKLRSILCGVLAIAAAVACKPDDVVETPKLDVDKTAVSVTAEAGQATFNVTTNQDWTASADADWVSVNPNNGKASDKAVAVKVTAEDNATEAERTATVTVKAGTLSKTVKVTQAAKAVTPDPGPDPEPETYILVGEAVGGWDVDKNGVVLTLKEGYYEARGISITAKKGMHFTKNNKWEGNVKGLHGLIAPDEIGEVGNNDISLTDGGSFDVYLAEALDKFYFMTPGKTPSDAVEHQDIAVVWGVCGALEGNSWGASADPEMTQEGEWYVAKNIAFTEVNFKVRGNNSWADDLKWGTAAKGQTCELNSAIAVSNCTDFKAENPSEGDNPNIYISVPAGAYDVYFSPEKKEVWVMTPGYKPGDEVPGGSEPEINVTELYILGGATDNGWSLDTMEAFENVGEVWIWEGNLKPAEQFRFPLQKVSNQWWPCLVPTADGTSVVYGTGDHVPNDFRVPEDGKYKVTVNPSDLSLSVERLGDRETAVIKVTELYMLGSACDTGWDLDNMEAFTNDGGIFTWTGNLKAAEEFRFPLQKVSGQWWPCLMIAADGSGLVYGTSDSEKVIYTVAETGKYTITIDARDFSNMTYTLEPYTDDPETPADPEIPADLVAYTIWEGNFESGSWGGMQDLAYGQYDWSARKPGQYLRFTCAPTNSSADWVISLRVGTDWEHINGIPQQFYNNVYDLVVELTDEIIADLVARQGLIVQGDNVTVTKIELYRKEINTGGESDTIDNIVTNSSFEDGASGWMGWWSGYTQTIVDEGRNGGSALLCTLSETSANLWEAQLYWSLPSADYLQVGVTYAYEYYVKSDSALTVQFLAQKPSDGYPAVYGPDTFKAGEDWTLMTGEFTYDGNPDSIDRVGIQFGGTPNAKLWVDDFIFGPKK